MLDKLETEIIRNCCDSNENLSLFIQEGDKKLTYRSRFLEVDFKKQLLVIDVPTSDSQEGKPLARGERFEGFFTFKKFRYLFNSVVLGHTKFKLQRNEVMAFFIRLPKGLLDGDRRDYFRVQTSMRPPVSVLFHLYEQGASDPVMSTVVENSPQEFQAEMVDISGGGFSIRTKLGDSPLDLKVGDVIDVKFRLKKGMEEMTIWSIVRNKRKYKGTEIVIWGLQFIEKHEQNRLLRSYRNKIMRFVTERQRELMLK